MWPQERAIFNLVLLSAAQVSVIDLGGVLEAPAAESLLCREGEPLVRYREGLCYISTTVILCSLKILERIHSAVVANCVFCHS